MPYVRKSYDNVNTNLINLSQNKHFEQLNIYLYIYFVVSSEKLGLYGFWLDGHVSF